jgi:hypothetical protein
MEKWRRVWRNGLAPQLSWAGLFNLRDALVNDDPRLMQGVVSSPPALDALRECAVKGTCAISYCGWRGEGLRTVGQIDEFFARICEAADAVFNEPAACRYFLNWFDDVPRALMRRELLAEVTLAMDGRRELAAA